MMRGRSTLPWVLAVVAAVLGGARFLDGPLGEWQADVVSPPVEGAAAPPAAKALVAAPRPGAAQTVVQLAALGVFRPLVLNFLWLRSLSHQRQGDFIEAVALARSITALEPRLPRVWAFQAWNLAYNVSVESPLADRFHWVIEGLRLLWARTAVAGTREPVACAEISRIFLDKIGSDLDEAHSIYKQRLADLVEKDLASAGEDSARRSQALLRWGLDASDLARIEARYVVGTVGGSPAAGRLDLRSPFAHALYWADVGLSDAPRRRDAYTAAMLRIYRLLALLRLLDSGRAVPRPGGGAWGFLPDLRFAAAIERALDEEESRAGGRLDRLDEVRQVRRSLLADLVAYNASSSRPEEAEAAYQELLARFGPKAGAGSRDRLVLSLVAREALSGTREEFEPRLCALLRGSLVAVLAGEEPLGRGLLVVAGSAHRHWSERSAGEPLPPLVDYHRALAHAFLDALEKKAVTRDLGVVLRSRLGDDLLRPPVNLLLTEPTARGAAFPFGLEALDPTGFRDLER
jgi:hypothetical protein